MEKVNFQNSKGLNLVGVLHIPKKDAKTAVIISRGFTSNKDRGRLVKLATILAENEIAALRFDFGGSGESNDREITIKEELNDLLSAISFLKNRGYYQIGLLGEGLGGLVSLLAYDKNIKAMVLWAPVTRARDSKIIQRKELKQELNGRGYISHFKDGKNFKIPKEYFQERMNINREGILKKIKIPVLIFHGDQDDELSFNDSRRALRFLPDGSRLEIIKGGDHKMDAQMDIVIPKTIKWFKQYLSESGGRRNQDE